MLQQRGSGQHPCPLSLPPSILFSLPPSISPSLSLSLLPVLHEPAGLPCAGCCSAVGGARPVSVPKELVSGLEVRQAGFSSEPTLEREALGQRPLGRDLSCLRGARVCTRPAALARRRAAQSLPAPCGRLSLGSGLPHQARRPSACVFRPGPVWSLPGPSAAAFMRDAAFAHTVPGPGRGHCWLPSVPSLVTPCCAWPVTGLDLAQGAPGRPSARVDGIHSHKASAVGQARCWEPREGEARTP